MLLVDALWTLPHSIGSGQREGQGDSATFESAAMLGLYGVCALVQLRQQRPQPGGRLQPVQQWQSALTA